MKHSTKILSITGIILISQWAYSSPITDNYATGDTLTADMLNNIKSAVNDNDQRVSALEVNLQATDFSGYGLPFSAIGEPKNVIVAVQENGDLTKRYRIRSRYQNNSEQISVDGVLTTPSLIAHYDTVEVDANGDVTSIIINTEAPETTSYLKFTSEGATLDINTLVKTVTSDTYGEDWTCSGGGAISTCNWTALTSGTPVGRNNWVSTYTSLGAGTISGMSFDDLRSEINTYSTGLRTRVRAKGIGEVLRQFSATTQSPVVAIYYRVDGVTGGSLAGTPFGSGGSLEGVLF